MGGFDGRKFHCPALVQSAGPCYHEGMRREHKAWLLLVALTFWCAPGVVPFTERTGGVKSCCSSVSCCASGHCSMGVRPVAKRDSCHMGAKHSSPAPARVCTCAVSSQNSILDFSHADFRFDLPQSLFWNGVPVSCAAPAPTTLHVLAGFASPAHQPPEQFS